VQPNGMYSVLRVALIDILLRDASLHAARPEALAWSSNSSGAQTSEVTGVVEGNEPTKQKSSIAFGASGHLTSKGTSADTEVGRASAKEAGSVVEHAKNYVTPSDQLFSRLGHLLNPVPDPNIVMDGHTMGAVMEKINGMDKAFKEVKEASKRWAKHSKSAILDGVRDIDRAAQQAAEAILDDHMKISEGIRRHFRNAMDDGEYTHGDQPVSGGNEFENELRRDVGLHRM